MRKADRRAKQTVAYLDVGPPLLELRPPLFERCCVVKAII